jgi:signal transduction histidine kinase
VALHRSGSLQSAVERSRARNLAVSLGILLLLALTVATLLVSANRTRELARQQIEFVAGVTHELRTPLAAIRTAGQNLADGVVGDEERVRQYGELVVREGRRLSELIEQALASAGIEARRGGLKGAPVPIGPVLAEAIGVCRALAEQKGTAIDEEIERSLPPVAADPSALRTMFENLVANAVKYGGDGGRVVVRARNGDSVKVSISDRGPGIAQADLPHIFEPFYRGEHSDDGRIAGSGLGLSLVKRIAEALGGGVAVTSSAGSGTTFTITLPAAGAEVAPAPAPLEAKT